MAFKMHVINGRPPMKLIEESLSSRDCHSDAIRMATLFLMDEGIGVYRHCFILRDAILYILAQFFHELGTYEISYMSRQ